MLPTDPYDPSMPDVPGPADPNAYETRGWGQSAPFPYATDQGGGAAMPQPGAPPPQQAPTFLMDSQAPPPGPRPADSLMAAALQRQAGPMWAPPQGGPEEMFGQMQDLQQRQKPGMPRPNPLRAAALIELGKLMQENGRTMKQHHALLEAFHALNGPSGPGGGGAE